MRSLINFFIKSDKFFLLPAVLTILLFLAVATTMFISSEKLPSQLPLLYSLPWGQDQLVKKVDFMLLPGILIILLVINSLLAWQLHKSQYILKRVLTLSLVLFDIIGLITILKILTIFI